LILIVMIDPSIEVNTDGLEEFVMILILVAIEVFGQGGNYMAVGNVKGAMKFFKTSNSRLIRSTTTGLIASFAITGVILGPTSISAASVESFPILRINFQGGFAGINPMDRYSQPMAVLDSFGHLLRRADATREPLPTLVPYTVVAVSKANKARIQALAKAAGLSKKLDAGIPPTADARELVVSFNGTTNVIASYGFGDDALPTGQLAVRKKIRALISYLDSLPRGTPTTPPSVVVTSFNYANHDPDPSRLYEPQPRKAWPSTYTPLDGSCVVLDGPTAVAAIIALQSSNVLTPWTSDGNVWRIVARPALPGDRGCRTG
jgi:hypothetical protein